MTIRIQYAGTVAEIGGKAAALSALADSGVPIPSWFAVCPGSDERTDIESALDSATTELREALDLLSTDGQPVAVRSSAVEEDSTAHSFAGQYESYLFVELSNVGRVIRELWQQAASERVVAYRAQHGLTGEAPLPAVLVQRMVNADVAGVAFSADPVSGHRSVAVVAATYGLGTSVVSGDQDADSWQVHRDGTIMQRTIVAKSVAHRRARVEVGGDVHGGVESTAVAESLVSAPALTDLQVREVAALARRTEQHFGMPQDIEWAIEDGRLFLLQSRPITSLHTLADPDGALILWDNSNIVESYGGITTPLTFSFARYVYENVYREFCRMLSVSPAKIESSEDALRSMLGLIRGRVYYNLVSWYRILALLPGYQVNRGFMEQMMGVQDALPENVAAQLAHTTTRSERYADMVSLVRMSFALIGVHRSMTRSIAAFEHRLAQALGTGVDLTTARPDELVAHYRDLERALLTRWDAPLANDFFAMIFYGILRKLTVSWCGDTHGTLQNDLVSGDGSVVSAEPAQRIVAMAGLIAGNTSVIDTLCDGTPASVRSAIAAHAPLHIAFEEYLARFGDRCLEELKLETFTLDDNPLLLAQSIGRVARAHALAPASTAERVDIRGDAERQAFSAIGKRPVRRLLFRWVLRHARHRIRDRENLRFERTRLFGRVRRIFVELGRRYHALGVLDNARDVFFLTVDEALGWPGAATASSGLNALAQARAVEFARYHDMPAPPDRFVTHGTAHVGVYEPLLPTSMVRDDDAGRGDDVAPARERHGTGCYPGVVRGLVRVVRDPRSAVLQPGEILVAERTDPGWVMLFPAASGLLVERGSLLSHSAIVARELALPAVVSVPGLTSWLVTGDEVEFNGRTGVITKLNDSQSRLPVADVAS